jgi:hypothetical protein
MLVQPAPSLRSARILRAAQLAPGLLSSGAPELRVRWGSASPTSAYAQMQCELTVIVADTDPGVSLVRCFDALDRACRNVNAEGGHHRPGALSRMPSRWVEGCGMTPPRIHAL